jgi:hypothetical protein
VRVCDQGSEVSVYAAIFVVYTIILYSLYASVVQPSSGGRICTLEINPTDNETVAFWDVY